MASKSGIAVVLASVVVGGGFGAVAGGCGEDRGSVDVEGGTTGSTVGTTTTPETTESTTPETTESTAPKTTESTAPKTTGTTETGTSGSGY